MIVAAVIQISTKETLRQRDLLPAESWFVVNEVYVPDFRAGENPSLIYNRTIREDFTGFWIVEVQRKQPDGLWATACSGNGISEYDKTEVIPNNTVTWEWFIGRPCPPTPGVHRLRVTYTMKRPGWPEKRLFTTSNEFRVRGPGAPLRP